MSAIFYIPNPTRVMRLQQHGGPAARAPRKRRLQGALAGFGVGGGVFCRLLFLWLWLREMPKTFQAHFHPPKTPAPQLTLHHHEHI